MMLTTNPQELTAQRNIAERRAETAEAKLAAVRDMADYWQTLADGDKYYGGRILDILDGAA